MQLLMQGYHVVLKFDSFGKHVPNAQPMSSNMKNHVTISEIDRISSLFVNFFRMLNLCFDALLTFI